MDAQVSRISTTLGKQCAGYHVAARNDRKGRGIDGDDDGETRNTYRRWIEVHLMNDLNMFTRRRWSLASTALRFVCIEVRIVALALAFAQSPFVLFVLSAIFHLSVDLLVNVAAVLLSASTHARQQRAINATLIKSAASTYVLCMRVRRDFIGTGVSD